ncbi:MAG: DMT family transporter [Chloroflexi bacterium]|nr:DMT family transporter [Chloroflexota bacterium]
MVTGILFGLASATVWATSSLMVKAQSARVDSFSFNAFRMIVTAIIFLAALPFFGGWDALANFSWTARAALTISIICGGAFGDSLYFWSMTQIGAARAMPLSGLYPLFTWAIAVPLLGEIVTVRAVIGTIVALIGLYLLAPARNGDAIINARVNRAGVLAAISAAILWAISTTMMKVGLQDGANVVVINSFRLPLGALVLAMILTRWRGRAAWSTLRRDDLPRLIALSVYGTALGSVLWIWSVEYAGAARAALVNSMAPLMGVPLAIIFLRERVTRRIVFGAL